VTTWAPGSAVLTGSVFRDSRITEQDLEKYSIVVALVDATTLSPARGHCGVNCAPVSDLPGMFELLLSDRY
jgi:hypothetical protein